MRALIILLALGLCAFNADTEMRIECKPKPAVDICPSHYTIDPETRVVDFWFCEPPTQTLAPDPTIDETIYATIEPDLISFDDKSMGRHFEFDRNTLTLTLTESTGERFESICTQQ